MDGELNYLKDETPKSLVTYTPYHVLRNGGIEVIDDYDMGKGEYLEVECDIVDGVLNISFADAKRNYSCIRIVCPDGVEELYVFAEWFTPAGHTRGLGINIHNVPIDENRPSRRISAINEHQGL